MNVDELKLLAAPLMALSEESMTAMVPDKTGFQFMGCPNCDKGSQERQLSWSMEDPEHVVCRYCGMAYPNEKYPEDRVLKITNPVGVEVEYPYYEDTDGSRFFFSARLWRETRTYFANKSEEFGELYRLTGDREYARRAALILDAFARYYPGFLVSRDWPFVPKGFVLKPPYPKDGGKWGRWSASEVPANVARAYGYIYASGELERLSEECGTDVKRRIEEDFFRGCIRYDAFSGAVYHNASPEIYEGYATMGRVMGDPGLVHEAVRRSKRLFELRFFEDGFWCEGSVGYHQMTMRGMAAVFTALKGYSDPPGYIDPDDGIRFDDLDMEQDIPSIQRALRIADICRYPDGRTFTVHDNWAYYRRLQIPEQSVSTLLPGVGHAWLGFGAGADQVQLHLHFSGSYGHAHADNLTIALFAHGQELLPDLGYSHTRHRTAWSKSTLSHNTVVIDEERQFAGNDKQPTDGTLQAFETAFEQIQWIEAGGERAYPDLAETYRRRVALVDAGNGDSYAVDFFQAAGGSQHDWALHGDADWDGLGTADIPLIPFGDNMLPGIDVRFPEGEAESGDAGGRNPSYAYFQNVSYGDVLDGVTTTFNVPERSVGVRTHIPDSPGSRLFLGDAISFRRAEENEEFIDRFRMPILLLRRTGKAPLSSLFTAVHEPFKNRPFIDSVTLNHPKESVTILSVKYGEITDYIIQNQRPLKAGDEAVVTEDLEFIGETGFIRLRKGLPIMIGLWGGLRLQYQGYTLTGSGIYEGEVIGTYSSLNGEEIDTLVVTGGVPEDATLRGAVAIITFGDGSTRGCRIERVKKSAGKTEIVLSDHSGFVVENGSARHVFFPHRTIEGKVTYRIRTSAFVEVECGRLLSVGQSSFRG